MEEVRQLVQEEGREARNLVAFHVAVDTPARISRKPPRSVLPPARRAPPRANRLRSASAGRDKRSELRARYWALLFGDLQRAIGEIYNTVEAHENLNECQEVILVLENYTRDFKALGEWFRLKWAYDNTPPPQRPQSLAWEIRKTDFVRPESRRTHSVKSSPSVSGKNSPSLSGHNTPSGKNSPVTGKASPASGKISPRISGYGSTSPKGNIEFFSNKTASKNTSKPEPKAAKDGRLFDIKEKELKEVNNDEVNKELTKIDETVESKESVVETGKAKELPNVSPKLVVVKSPKNKAKPDELSSQGKATINILDSMENEFLNKQLVENQVKNDNLLNIEREVEGNYINTSKIENKVTNVGEVSSEPKDSSIESLIKSDDHFADVSAESSPNSLIDEKSDLNSSKQNEKTDDLNDTSIENKAKDIKDAIIDPKELDSKVNGKKLESKDTKDVLNEKEESKKDEVKKADAKLVSEQKPNSRPAYSQAAAKPKPVTVTVKTDTKTTVKPSPVFRTKNVVEIPNAAKPRQFPKRNQTSKCSYPFNLTTGRTSLFDTPTAKVVTKKNLPIGPIRNVQLGSGDGKLLAKVDIKKRPPRPTALKMNEKGDKKEKAATNLEKIKDCDEFSSTDTIVTQIEMSRIESSESLKTLVPDELMILDVANSVEVLNVDNNKNDNDGWLTVKSRRLSRESKKQYKSHWANRFHQPSATTSLPTLNLISPRREANPIIKPENTDRAKSEQPELVKKPEKVKLVVKPKSTTKKDPAMIRQKSDVTGLKTHSARNKLNKKEKVKNETNEGDLTKNRLHSSLESLTMGLARSQESTKEAFDFDKWKAEFKSTFKYLEEDDQIPNHNEILKTADPSEMSEIAEMTSQIEENERKISLALDFQSDVDQLKLCEEEDLLNRQIMELQQVSDIDLDTETDDTETDAEIICEDTSLPPSSSPSLGSLAASLEHQYETALAGMSWAERVDTLVLLQDLVARDPGRAQQLHVKLSQGIKRRGSFQDALRRLQAKQARAERQRQNLQTERAKKIHQLLGRVEEVKVAKNQLIEEKRLRMERRLQKAAENRDQHLKDIVRKAHDEEEKLREIAFIKQLEAENRRHDFLAQCRSHTTRLRQMRRDRLYKLEQKAAREAAVGARRQALEAARKLHVESLLEKRKERDARLEELKELKKQERDDAAREKAEGVKSRLSALAAAAELEADALRSRIRDKQDASQQRLESHLQAIREKATGPRQTTTSESLDPTSREEKELQEEAERLEIERKEREKLKSIKKKARKVKQKLLSTCNETLIFVDTPSLELNNPALNKLYKVTNQINNILTPLLDIDNTENGKNNDNHFDDDQKDDITSEKKKNVKKKTSEKEIEIIVTAQNDIETENTGKKRNRKKSKDLDSVERPKLSKTSSICSSLSDASKASVKTDRKTRVVIDVTLLERQLNELSRFMEKLDQNAKDKSIPQKIHGLKIVGQLLAVAAEREDLTTQFSTKSLTTAVSIATKLMSNCRVCAAYSVSSNVSVHAIKLLAALLEKDLHSDQKETELATLLCNCLSLSLSSVLHSSKVLEQRPIVGQDAELVTKLRNRAHTTISYLCLCGCVTKAENAGEVRDSFHQLLTVCAELCHPCEFDVGTARTSAVQSLTSSLGSRVCGARAALCLLLARDTRPQHAAGTATLLTKLAILHHHIVQEAFGEGGWPLEFKAAVARLLSQYAPNDKEAPKPNHRTEAENLEHNMSEALVLDLIVLVGFVVVGNPQLQETICDGWSVIKTLCTLPANWLVSKPHCDVLLPTLVALAEWKSAKEAIAGELSLNMLEEYIESPEAQHVKLVQVIKQVRNADKKATGKK